MIDYTLNLISVKKIGRILVIRILNNLIGLSVISHMSGTIYLFNHVAVKWRNKSLEQIKKDVHSFEDTQWKKWVRRKQGN